MTAEEEVK